MRKKARKRVSSDIPAKGRLRDFADTLWSWCVRDDWGMKCAMCSATNVEAHHIFCRVWEATRYDLRNGIALCPTHHKYCPDRSPHMCAPGFMLWINRKFPDLHKWIVSVGETQHHKSFNGTKTAWHYIDIIKELRTHMPHEDFEYIVKRDGFVKFMAWLDTESE